MSYERRLAIHFLGKKRIHPVEICNRLEAQYDLHTYGLPSVHDSCQLFDWGRENSKDGPKLANLPISHRDAKIRVYLEREPFSST
jgi:hypothetical protein